MFNRSNIAREAHRIARIYAPTVGYRKALSWGFQSAWRHAKDVATRIERDAAMSVRARAVRDEAIAIQCSTDGPLPPVALNRLNELRIAA